MKKIFKHFALFLSLLLSTISLFSCANINNNQTENSSPIVILHAGGGYDGLTYLNAQETFNIYYQQGYRYFEYDVKLSSDGKIIGSHAGEHLGYATPEDLTYEEFKKLKLSNGLTPCNEEWLVQTMISHPDVKIIVDAKMNTTQGDIAVIQRFEQLEGFYDLDYNDFSSSIIPEVFSLEMWNELKKTTTFEKYLFSHYKVYYSIDEMLEYFNDNRIFGISLPLWSDNYICSNIYKLKQAEKKIFIFTPTNKEEVNKAYSLDIDGLYVDFPNIVQIFD